MTAGPIRLAALPSLVGREIGVSDWHLVDQDRISAFAAVTGDRQFIHVDPQKAAQTPLGGAVAHGFLSLSLLSVMFNQAIGEIGGAGMSMNYGFNSVRFLSPVRAGARLRARFTLSDCSERKPGQWQLTLTTTLETEGEERPALAAEWLVLLFAAP